MKKIFDDSDEEKEQARPKRMIEKIIDNDTKIVTNDDMMSKVFKYDEADVLVIKDKKGDYWYKGKDIATILEYTDTKGALKRHVSEEYKKSFADMWHGKHAT